MSKETSIPSKQNLIDLLATYGTSLLGALRDRFSRYDKAANDIEAMPTEYHLKAFRGFLAEAGISDSQFVAYGAKFPRVMDGGCSQQPCYIVNLQESGESFSSFIYNNQKHSVPIDKDSALALDTHWKNCRTFIEENRRGNASPIADTPQILLSDEDSMGLFSVKEIGAYGFRFYGSINGDIWRGTYFTGRAEITLESLRQLLNKDIGGAN